MPSHLPEIREIFVPTYGSVLLRYFTGYETMKEYPAFSKTDVAGNKIQKDSLSSLISKVLVTMRPALALVANPQVGFLRCNDGH